MDWVQFILAFAILCGMAGGGFAGVVLLRSSSYQTTITLLSSEVEAFKTKVELLEEAHKHCEERLSESDMKYDRLEADHEMLKAMLPTGPHISEIKTYMDARFDDMIAQLGGRPSGRNNTD